MLIFRQGGIGISAPPPPPSFFGGDPNSLISSINTGGGIVMSRTSGNTPAFVQVSAANILASGSVLDAYGNAITGAEIRPYERLEYTWNFGDPSGIEKFTNPVTGLIVNANTDQMGPEACYVYRNPGMYTITLNIRGKSGNSFVNTSVTSPLFIVSAFTPSAADANNGDYYFNSNAPNDSGDGTIGNPWQNLYGGHGPISTTGHISGTGPIRINLAYGSAWTGPSGGGDALNITTAITGLRIQAFGNSSLAKPKIQSTGTVNNGLLVIGQPLADCVISNIDFELNSLVTSGNGAVINLSRNGNISRGTTFVGSIGGSAGGAGTQLTGVAGNTGVVKGLNQTANGQTLFAASGPLAPGNPPTKINNGTFTSVDTAQNISNQLMLSCTPGTSNIVFTGSITSNVLTVSNVSGTLPTSPSTTPPWPLLDLTGVIGVRTLGNFISGSQWNVSAGPDVPSQMMFTGSPGNQVNDVYFDNVIAVNSLAGSGASGISLLGGGANLFAAKTSYQRVALWGCTSTAFTGGSQFGQAFGAYQWMSWVGGYYGATGPSPGGPFIHHVNPENTSNHGLFRWNTVNSGPGTPQSWLNYGFEPRADNMYNGTLNGDYFGGNFLVADSKLGYSQNGINFANQANWNPSSTFGQYDNVVIERCWLGPFTTASIQLTGTTHTTIRDCKMWGSSGNITPSGNNTNPGVLSVAAWLKLCAYRNLMYRPQNVPVVGFNAELPGNGMLYMFPQADHMAFQQEFTDNIMWDNRSGAKSPAVINVVFADQANPPGPPASTTVPPGSIFVRNQYYAPGNPAFFTGSISGSVLTVTSPTGGPILTGAIMGTLGGVAANTLITGQLSGTPGGAGTYSVSISQTVSTASMTSSAGYLQNNGVANTLAQWQAAGGSPNNLDPDAIYAQPSWSSPETGGF